MLLNKEGFPEEGELVLCTVTKIHFHSVFVNLDEYNRSGLIHISEVSPGRIRNIRDFVIEGRKVVCKVLRVNKEKGYIDLSLRRVNDNQKRLKISEIKQEQLAEKIVEFIAKKLDMPLTNLYKQVVEKVFKKYDSLYSCFQDVVKGEDVLRKLGVEEKVAKELEESIKLRIKEVEVEIKGDLRILSYAPNGVEIIKEALKKAENVGKEQIKITCEGSGKYRITIKSDNYKDAEKLMEKAANKSIEYVKDYKGQASFARLEE
jgi:translation initiation factor 2 subunit 1|tara:strand:+ start:1893 stop:2675 length:783 start_codon:yes stop_codon:yes gene_type:complete